MAFRETFQTDTLALDVGLNEEMISVKACWAQRDSVAPSGVSVCGFTRVESTSDPCYFRHFIYRYDGSTGTFIDRTNAFSAVYGGLVRRISWHDGVLVFWRDLSTFTLDPDTFAIVDFQNSLFPATGHWDAQWATQEHFGWDRNSDYWFQNSSGIPSNQLGVYVASTGVDTGVRINVTGAIDPPGFQGAATEVTRPPYGFAVGPGGTYVYFNYVTGQILNVTRMPFWDDAAGELTDERVYGYDSFNDRVLLLDKPDDVAGDFPGFIRGFNPTPQAVRLLQPVAVREPRINNDAVRIFTRAIGSSGEGIGNLSVTFSDQAVGDVAPVEVTTDRFGYAEALYDGLATGGAETITVTTETLPDIFPPAPDQGSGGSISLWTPEVHLDFRDQLAGADVSALITEQVDWDKGTDPYGVDANTSIFRVGRVSGARLRIQSGDDGTPTSPTNGTFGGDLAIAVADQVAETGELWVGAWVQFPAGFDFTATTGLMLFRIGNDVTANHMTVRFKHAAGAHTGYVFEWPDETVTETRHDFNAHTQVLIDDDTWHFFQYYCQANSDGTLTSQRFWFDDLIVWELIDDQAQYREQASSALVSFTANEAIPMLTTTGQLLDELKVFNEWSGNAPGDETCYVGNVVWTRDTDDELPTDENGNQYISPIAAEAL